MGQRRKQARLVLRDIKSRTPGRAIQVYYIRDGKQFLSTGCGPERLGDAEQALALHITSRGARAGGLGTPAAKVSVAAVLTGYALGPAQLAPDPTTVKAHLDRIADFFAADMVEDINPGRCEAYVAWRTRQPVRSFKDAKRARRIDPQTARRELEELQIAIAWYDRSISALSQLPRFRFPEKSHHPRDALDRSQAARFLHAARGRRYCGDGRWKALPASTGANRAHVRRQFLLGIYTGSRPSVLTELRWRPSDHHAYVDLDAGVLHRRGRRAVDRRTKRRPAAPIPTRLLSHLRRWKRIDDRRNAARAQAGLEPIVSVVHHGGEALRGPIRTAYAGIARDARLAVQPTPHWLRHTCATWLMRSGMDITLVSEFLGVSVRILVKHYGHLRPDYVDELNAAINRSSRMRRDARGAR